MPGRTHDVRAPLWSAAPGRNEWISGYRLACAVLLPIALGAAVGLPRTGLLIGVGAFIVGNVDLDRSYQQRLRLMMPTTLCVGLLTLLGLVTGTSRPGAVVLGGIVLLLGGLAAAFGREAARLGTLVSFSYVIGVALAGLGVVGVVVPVLLGGGYAIVLCWLQATTVRRKTDELPEPWSSLATRSRAHLDTGVIRRACALAIAGGIGLAIVPFTPQSNGAWVVTGALIVLKPGYRDTLRIASLRGAGTVAGAAAAGATVAATTGAWIPLVIALLVATLAEAAIRRSFGLFVVLTTSLAVLLSDVLMPGDWSVTYLRTADVAVGAAIAIVVSTVLYPHRWLRSAADHDEAAARPR